MRVFYLGKFSKLWDEEAIALGLEAAGCEVVRLEQDNCTAEGLLSKMADDKPDVFLGAKYQLQGAREFIESLREMGIPTVSWTFDLLLGHPPREKLLPAFAFLWTDTAILTDGGHNKEYKELGVEKKTLRQGIPDEFCYMDDNPPERDIIFVGTENPTFPYRQRTMHFLTKEYPGRFHWYGRGNAEEVRGHKLNDLYSKSKIVIGDSMFSPNYWSNRIYETLGRGGFLIHPFVEGLDKEFKPYKEFVPYQWGDYAGLKKKIDYFLTHDAERDVIRKAGFERVKKEYKMSDRCKVLCKELEHAKNKGNNIST